MLINETAGVFSVIGPLKKVYDYIRGVKDTREVERQLVNVLHPLSNFVILARETKERGVDMESYFHNLKPPIDVTELEKIVELISEFLDAYSQFLFSFRLFAKGCSDLFSGDFDVFLNKVKVRKPEVYEIMAFFAKHYDPKKGVLDLERLSTLVRIYGEKGVWKENSKLSKTVTEGKEKIKEAKEKSKLIRAQGLVIRNRAVVMRFIRSLRRAANESKKFHATGSVTKELRSSGPSWFRDLSDTVQEVGSQLQQEGIWGNFDRDRRHST